MNHYGSQALTHWQQHRRRELARIEDPEEFFTLLGEEIAGQITSLTSALETSPGLRVETETRLRENGRTYLDQVAARMTARRIAEEVVMSQMVWTGDPSLPLDQAREEWEQTRPADQNLISWAERAQDSPYPVYSTVEIEAKAQEWALPVTFLEGLLAAEIPGRYAQEHQQILDQAADVRFLREVQGTP